MKEVIFKEVGMKNFGPYIQPMILTFQNDQLILICGPNGIGKTMLLDAIPYNLYGLTSKGAKGDDVVNNVVKKDCKTWLNFSINSDEYRIERYHKYKKKGNTVLLFKNDMQNPIKKGQTEVLPEIERIVAPRKLFMNTLMFGQKVKDFFTDLTDSEKKEIFRKILDLDSYTLFHSECSNRIKSTEEKLQQVSNSITVNVKLRIDSELQIQSLEESKISFEVDKLTRIKELEGRIILLDRDRLERLQSLKEFDKEDLNLDKCKKDETELESLLNHINDKFKTSAQDINNQKKLKILNLTNEASKVKETEIFVVQESIKKLAADFHKEKDLIVTLAQTLIEEKGDLQGQYIDINGTIANLEEDNEELINNVIKAEISTCPTCRQPITPKIFKELNDKVDFNQNKIESLQRDIESILKSISNLDLEMISRRQKIKDLETNFQNQKNKLEREIIATTSKINSRLASLINQVENVEENELKNLAILQSKEKEEITQNLELVRCEKERKTKLINEKTAIEQQISSMDENLRRLKERKEEVKKEQPTHFDNQIIALEEKKKILNQEIQTYEETKDKLTRELKIFEFWKIAFSSSGIPSMLIDESIPFMNANVAKYLDMISNGRYMVTFDTLSSTKAGEFRDKIQVNMFDNVTKSLGRLQFSGGQVRIVDIATILTLCDLQSHIRDISFNILLFDEIFDSLDSENTDLVSNVLRSLIKNKTICIISHRHLDQIEADQVLNLR